MEFSVKVEEKQVGVFTVQPLGYLDSNTSPGFKERVDTLLNSKAKVLIFDLKDLEYISSAGLQVFFAAKKNLKERDGKLFFMNLQPQIRKVFDIIKALPMLNIFKNVEEMDDYLDAMQKKAMGTWEED